MDVVSGMPFGQERTQFCELPHPSMPPSAMRASSRSWACIAPVGWALNSRTWEIAAGPMKVERSLTFGHASRHTPQVMHLDSSYAHWRLCSGMRGPGPRSYVPSMGIHALTRLSASNIRERSTIRSRTTGNVFIGESRIGHSSLSTSAEQAWRGLPLMTIEQAPHTSSRQFDSQTTGFVRSPFALTGLRWISISALMTFMFGRYGMSNSSKYGAESGLS